MTHALFEYLTPQTDTRLMQKLLAKYKQLYLAKGGAASKMFPGARQMLEELSSAKVPIVITSNKAADILRRTCYSVKVRCICSTGSRDRTGRVL